MLENQRTLLFIALFAISAVLYTKWIDFTQPEPTPKLTNSESTDNILSDPNSALPSRPIAANDTSVPSTPVSQDVKLPEQTKNVVTQHEENLITVTTDLLIAKINPVGGVIQRIELRDEPISIEQADQGFALLHRTNVDTFVAEDGLLANGLSAPNHIDTHYVSARRDYDLDIAEQIRIPLTWHSQEGVEYTKTLTFTRNSYVVNIDYQVKNNSTKPWKGYLYAQFSRSEPRDSGGGFGQLPSFTGGAIYTEAEKYEKIDFDDMRDEPLALETNNGWVAMLQHYFVGAWIPGNEENKQFYTGAERDSVNPNYRIGYKTLDPVVVAVGTSGQIGTKAYLGSKEQKRLKRIQKNNNIAGLALTVDYGFLTFIADPLFIVLSWIHDVVGNWGWSIILLTILIKILFYPLSAASFRSMAGMKKLQPRIQTLKERYKDDKQKFQMEMMGLYKKEKINPAGGCLPILIQIPVFISLYWVLLESVEMRHAPFALWLQDLSAKDPYYVLPVLMGLSMWAQQKLNPAPTDEIQKKVMAIMPIALTFLFLTFPQGLVLYWVVNNVLQMAQQWFVYRQIENAEKGK